jgi:hypothetical protein
MKRLPKTASTNYWYMHVILYAHAELCFCTLCFPLLTVSDLLVVFLVPCVVTLLAVSDLLFVFLVPCVVALCPTYSLFFWYLVLLLY